MGPGGFRSSDGADFMGVSQWETGQEAAVAAERRRPWLLGALAVVAVAFVLAAVTFFVLRDATDRRPRAGDPHGDRNHRDRRDQRRRRRRRRRHPSRELTVARPRRPRRPDADRAGHRRRAPSDHHHRGGRTGRPAGRAPTRHRLRAGLCRAGRVRRRRSRVRRAGRRAAGRGPAARRCRGRPDGHLLRDLRRAEQQRRPLCRAVRRPLPGLRGAARERRRTPSSRAPPRRPPPSTCPASARPRWSRVPTIDAVGQTGVWVGELQRVLGNRLNIPILDLAGNWGTFTASTATAVAQFQASRRAAGRRRRGHRHLAGAAAGAVLTGALD